jgi:hypothetical protein
MRKRDNVFSTPVCNRRWKRMRYHCFISQSLRQTTIPRGFDLGCNAVQGRALAACVLHDMRVFSMYEGKIVAPHHGAGTLLSTVLVSAVSMTPLTRLTGPGVGLVEPTGAVLRTGAPVSSFAKPCGERHAVHIVHANVRYFATYHHQSHRYLPTDEVISLRPMPLSHATDSHLHGGPVSPC